MESSRTHPSTPASSSETAAGECGKELRARSALLDRIQGIIEQIYGLSLELNAADYVIDAETLEAIIDRCTDSYSHRGSWDRILVVEEPDELLISIYINERSLDNLGSNDPLLCLDQGNFSDFCSVTEEVSHFVCVAWHANSTRSVTRLELELQAEIDKFLLCAVALRGRLRVGVLPRLLSRLFERYELRDDLSDEERSRYELASRLAMRYCASLARRWTRQSPPPGLWPELRKFYRLSQSEKISRIRLLPGQ